MNVSKPWRATVSDAQIRGWRRAGYTIEKIAEATGMRTSEVLHRIQEVYSVPRSPDPDEATIRRLCAEIRAGWSEEERLEREVSRHGEWRPIAVPESVVESALNWPTGCGGPHEFMPTSAQS